MLAGWWLALGHLVTALALALTIIGLPFAGTFEARRPGAVAGRQDGGDNRGSRPNASRGAAKVSDADLLKLARTFNHSLDRELSR